jgi:dUTP pyrophosphatase
MAGVIDSVYRGELKIIVQNHGDQFFTVQNGDKIAQLVELRTGGTSQLKFEEVDELPSSDRGAQGFGSSGTR